MERRPPRSSTAAGRKTASLMGTTPSGPHRRSSLTLLYRCLRTVEGAWARSGGRGRASWPPSWRARRKAKGAGRRDAKTGRPRGASRGRAAIFSGRSLGNEPRSRRGVRRGGFDARGRRRRVALPALRARFVHEHIAYFFRRLSNAPFARRRARAQTRPVVLHVRQQRPQLPTRLAAREYHARVRRRDQAASPRPGQTRAFLRAEKATDKAICGKSDWEKIFRIANTCGENRGNEHSEPVVKKCDLNKPRILREDCGRAVDFVCPTFRIETRFFFGGNDDRLMGNICARGCPTLES